MVDIDEVMRENWMGECRECNWSHSDIGSMAVSVEARIHICEEGGHSVEVYRDDDLMEVIESVIETGPYKQHLNQDAAPLRDREQEQERIAREVADPDSETNEKSDSDS